AHASMAKAQCVIHARGVRLSRIVVRPPQAEAFQVDLGSYLPGSGVEAADLTLPDNASRAARVHVSSAIAFDGTRMNPVFQVHEPITTNHGMVELSPGALVSDAHAHGRAVTGSVPLSFDDTDEPWSTISPGELIPSLEVPCEALGLPDLAPQTQTAGEQLDENVGEREAEVWRLRTPASRVVLRSLPASGGAWAVLVRGPLQGDSQFSFRRLDEHAGWMKVLHVGTWWGEQAAITGWIRRSELEPTQQYWLDDGIDQTQPAGGCGYEHRDGRSSPPAPAYEGRARIPLGTRIYAEPKRGPWATVQQNVDFYVKYFPGDTWAWVDGIPNIRMTNCAEPMPAYVPVAMLTLPQAKSP
ncbi:MAG: hypothetical protein ABI627_27665, partial [Polyangiaceae bacterium]